VQRHFACLDDDLAPGTSMVVEGSVPIAVFRTDAGEVFATADTCTHEKWSLGEDGDLEGDEIVCPLHMARFDLRTGRALCLPAMVALQTYQVEVVEGRIYVVE